MALRVAYIMSRFPHLPETFILREMEELERQGWTIALYPLILQKKQPVIHAEAQAWISRVQSVTPLETMTIFENGRTFLQQPMRLGATWLQMIHENLGSPNFLARAIYLFPQAVRMAALMQREGIRHIHAHYATHPALAAWIISRLTGITYSITVHAHDIFVRTAMLATKLRSAAFVVAISEYNREYLVRRLGTWVDEKIIVIHCGIRPELYPQRAHSDTPNERASAPFQIIHVGSLQAYKGQQYLIKACALLRQRAIPFYCKIVGSGEELQRLQRLVQEEGLQEWITFMGARTQQEVAQLLSHADCYVQPSIVTSAGKMEGIPVALMEAMAAGVPCIATQISGIPELIRHQVTGWLVVPKDVQGLADCLDVVYRDPVGAAQVARAGRHVVLDQFDLSANVHQLAARMAPMVQE